MDSDSDSSSGSAPPMAKTARLAPPAYGSGSGSGFDSGSGSGSAPPVARNARPVPPATGSAAHHTGGDASTELGGGNDGGGGSSNGGSARDGDTLSGNHVDTSVAGGTANAVDGAPPPTRPTPPASPPGGVPAGSHDSAASQQHTEKGAARFCGGATNCSAGCGCPWQRGNTPGPATPLRLPHHCRRPARGLRVRSPRWPLLPLNGYRRSPPPSS